MINRFVTFYYLSIFVSFYLTRTICNIPSSMLQRKKTVILDSVAESDGFRLNKMWCIQEHVFHIGVLMCLCKIIVNSECLDDGLVFSCCNVKPKHCNV